MFILFQKQRHITKHQQNLPTILRHISTFPHLLGNGIIHEYRTQMRVRVLKITVLPLDPRPGMLSWLPYATVSGVNVID